MGTKLVKNVDDDIWRKFTGKCKMDNERVGVKISKVLENYLKEGKR